MILRGLALASLSVCLLLPGDARAQSIPQSMPDTSATQQQQDRSFYLGTPVTHPEDLSGVWEAPDGHGGAVGIHLILDTTAPVDANTLSGTQQSWLGLQVGLYRRTAELQPGDESYFSDSPRGGSVRYEQDRLTLHLSGYDLDLHRLAGDKWSGRFHRGDFDAAVTLTRPMLQTTSKDTWFLGTWKSTSGPQTTCLHIAKATPVAFLAWSDTLLAWGAIRFAPQTTKPPYSWEHYGDLVKVESAGHSSLSVELGAYSAICCSHRFHATSAEHGNEMKADWPAGPNQSPHKSKWTKMPGGTCIAPTE